MQGINTKKRKIELIPVRKVEEEAFPHAVRRSITNVIYNKK